MSEQLHYLCKSDRWSDAEFLITSFPRQYVIDALFVRRTASALHYVAHKGPLELFLSMTALAEHDVSQFPQALLIENRGGLNPLAYAIKFDLGTAVIALLADATAAYERALSDAINEVGLKYNVPEEVKRDEIMPCLSTLESALVYVK